MEVMKNVSQKTWTQQIQEVVIHKIIERESRIDEMEYQHFILIDSLQIETPEDMPFLDYIVYFKKEFDARASEEMKEKIAKIRNEIRMLNNEIEIYKDQFMPKSERLAYRGKRKNSE